MKALLTKPSNDSPLRKNLPPPAPVSRHPVTPIPDNVLSLQRKPNCACGGGCPRCESALPIQTKLAVNEPGDIYEQEADRVAEEVMQMPAPTLQRACASCAAGEPTCPKCEAENQGLVQRQAEHASNAGGSVPDSFVHSLGPGQPLDSNTRAFFEPRFGYDFSQVRLHTDARAAESARAVNALAYTVGRDVVFAAGQYAPAAGGRRLLAHELSHVVQQGAAQSVDGGAPADPSGQLVLQRQAGPSGGGAALCSPPSDCPADFCTPFSSQLVAEAVRAASAPILLAGIAVKVSPRVVPLWNQYLFGGASSQDLSSQFGADFTNSQTTADTTDFLVDELKTNLESNPPSFPSGTNTVTVDIPSRIGSAITEIGNPNSVHPMDFNVIGEIPGNIAGGIGKTQKSCPAGAQPSPFDDDRTAAGTAEVTRNADGTLTVVPSIAYTVQDTIDLCPGNCGAPQEQIATVPMSRMEASGISGDVPFTVEFPAPPRSVIARPPVVPPAPPVPTPTPITGETTASALRIRQGPSTSFPILGLFPRGSIIAILCQTTGTNVEGNRTWDKTDQGFVSDRYVRRIGTGTPPNC